MSMSSSSSFLPHHLNFTIDRPRFDQSTYLGRVRHFLDVIDPLTLLTRDHQLNAALQTLHNYKKGILPNLGPNAQKHEIEEALWQAKKIKVNKRRNGVQRKVVSSSESAQHSTAYCTGARHWRSSHTQVQHRGDHSFSQICSY
jgi:hypothetical protein